jgi:hypothetical protein
MGAGYAYGEPSDGTGGLPADPANWSEASRRSVGAIFPPRPYTDIEYVCWRCKRPDVFTAEQQKHAYEVRKAYIWQQRILCRECYRERQALEQEARVCRRRWADERRSLRSDLGFLRRWLTVLEALPEYKGTADRANIAMLWRLVASQQDTSPDDVLEMVAE